MVGAGGYTYIRLAGGAMKGEKEEKQNAAAIKSNAPARARSGGSGVRPRGLEREGVGKSQGQQASGLILATTAAMRGNRHRLGFPLARREWKDFSRAASIGPPTPTLLQTGGPRGVLAERRRAKNKYVPPENSAAPLLFRA
ncbi:hypothetical protein MTO96_012005 [Rhipicephalus appendiculatus]